MRERKKRTEHAVREEGGEKVKDMLVHAMKEALDTLCTRISYFQHIYDYILEEHTFYIVTFSYFFFALQPKIICQCNNLL